MMQQYNAGDGVVQFLRLDVAAEDYVPIEPPMSLDLTTLGFTTAAALNASAIDHATGKIFGAISDGSESWLIQYDMSPTPNVRYLGQLTRGPQTMYAATVTSEGTYVFNFGNKGMLPSTTFRHFPFENDDATETLGVKVYGGSMFGPAGDFPSMTLADGQEIIVGYNNATEKITYSPIDNLGAPVELTVPALESFATGSG